MWIDNLKYRDTIDSNQNITFGIEIEFDNARKRLIKELLENAYKDKIISKPWKIENEETIYEDSKIYSVRGGEAISDILTDNKEVWNDIKYVCNKIKSYGGKTTSRCGAHVHIGANILEDNIKYYERFLKIWSLYEEIITRFCYGEDPYPRKYMELFAKPSHDLIRSLFKYCYDFNKNNFIISKEDFMKNIDYFLGLKNLSLSFKGINEEYLKTKYKNTNDWYKHKTIEFRSGNGTLNPTIWQNYINLYSKILLCCLDNNKDWDEIDREFKKNINKKSIPIYDYDKAIDFCNFVFNNELDKYNFMLQYDKEIYKDDKNYIPKAKKKIK